MHINSVNFLNYYNSRLLTMGRTSPFGNIETPEDLNKITSELKNLPSVDEKFILLDKIVTSAYNLIKIKKIAIVGDDLVDEMLNAMTYCGDNQKGTFYFADVERFAKITGCLPDKKNVIEQKARECGCVNFSCYFHDKRRPYCSYSNTYGERFMPNRHYRKPGK